MVRLEPLREEHRISVIDIFNYYIKNTNYAFRREEVAYSHFDKYLENAKKLCGYAITDDATATVIGFCQLKPYDPLSTFDHTVETTYFLEPGSTRKGIGTLILHRLIEDAKRLKKQQMIASISGDNIASINFHKKHDFNECGRFRNVGNKFEKDFDIVYMQKEL